MMSRWTYAACLLAVLVVLSILPSSAPAQDPNYLIVPGQRVGRWELGKPLDAYGFGQQTARWEGTAGGKPYYDGYTFPQPPRGPFLNVYTCRTDNLVMAILVEQRLNTPPLPDPEELRYMTAEGVRIGMEENEVLRILGRPDGTWQSTARHGQFEFLMRGLDYWSRGFFVRVNRADLKVFAIGAAKDGGFTACQQAVLGGPPAAQQPAPVFTPAPRATIRELTTPSALRIAARAMDISLPIDVRVIKPGSDVPANIAAFSGMWVGDVTWGPTYGRRLIYVVEQILSVRMVRIFYAWGPLYGSPAGWTRLRGTFDKDSIIVEQSYKQADEIIQKKYVFKLLSANMLRVHEEITSSRYGIIRPNSGPSGITSMLERLPE